MNRNSESAKFPRRMQFGVMLALSVFAAHSTSAATEQWQGVPNVSATTNWTDANNWTAPQQTYYNQVQFTGTGASANNVFTVNNVLDSTTGVAQVPVWELDYTPVNGNYTTLINSGVTLQLAAGNGSLHVGADILSGSAAPANAVETIGFTGAGGTFSMNGILYLAQGSVLAGDTHNITLDMSGLDNFIDSGGNEILVACGGAARSHGTFYLAKTNLIALGNDFLLCNQNSSNSVLCAIYLGQQNSIQTGGGNLTIGGFGTTTVGAWMKFNPAFLGGANPPTASFGGTGGDGRIVNFWISDANGGPQVSGAALCDFTGGSISLLARAMQLGQGGNAGANASGTLTFDNGVVDVNNATIGVQEVSSGGTGVGVVNLNANAGLGTNGTLRVNNTLTLAAVTGTLTGGTAGSININGGALVANNIVSGGGAARINVTNGAFTVTGAAGSVAAPLTGIISVNSSINLAISHASTNIFTASLATGGAGNTISITAVPPAPAYPVQITLVKYSGAIGGAGYDFSLGSLPPLCAGRLSNNVANGSIDLVLTSGPLTDTWTGAINGNWDTSTANWSAGGAVNYADGAFVQFLDGASVSTVNLTTTLSPGGTTVSNNTLNYTFNGTGKLSGTGAVVKQGTGTLAIDNSGVNDFTGGLTIGGGTVQVGNGDTSGNLPTGAIANSGVLAIDRTDNTTFSSAVSGPGSLMQEGAGSTLLVSGGSSFSGPVLVTNGSTLKVGGSSALGNSSGNVIVANGSTLDANGYTVTNTILVAGTGVSGSGALTDSGGNLYDNPGPGFSPHIALTGDTTFYFPTRWDLGSASGGNTLGTDGNPHNLTLNSSSGYFEWRNLTVLSPLANINIAAGNLGVTGSMTFGDPAGTLAIYNGAALTIYGANVYINKQVDFQGGGTLNNAYGDNTMSGGMTLEPGFCTFSIGGGTSLSISNVLTGPGIFYLSGGTGTTTLSGNSPSFTGGVYLYNGQLTLNGLIGSGITSLAGTTLAGSGAANGLVDVSGAFLPGGLGAAGTFTAGGGLILESSATLTMDLSSSIGGSNDLVAVTGNLTVNGNNISINPLTGSLASGSYTLFTYSGTLSGSFGTASTVASSRYIFAIDTSTAHQVKLVVTGAGDLLAWNNAANNGQWDVQSSLNWSNLTTHAEDQFFTSDTVLLDDSIGTAAHPLATLTVPNGQIVVPNVITNNSTTNYSLTGPGKISGGASLVKLGSSTLNITMTNDYTGNTTVAGGALQISGQLQSASSPIGAAGGKLIITNGATVIVNLQGGYPSGDIGFGAKPVVVSGAGAGGNGAIQNNGNPIYSDSSTLAGLGKSITLAGNTTIGGTARWDWGYPGQGVTLSTQGSNYNFTIIESGYSQWSDLAIDTNLGNIDFYTPATSQQQWRVAALGVSLGNPTNTLTLHSNILMNIQHGDTIAGDNGYAKIIHVFPTAAFQFQPSGGAGDYRLATSFILDDGSTFAFYSGNGGSNSGTVISGTVAFNGLVHLQIGNSLVTFSNVISGTGGFYWDNYDNTVVFAAANTYQGITDIRSGRTLALVGNGSIGSSTNINIASSAVIDVSGRSDQKLTLNTGQVLQGSGTVNGSLLVNSGATVVPGGSNTIGTLTVTNTVTLAGTTLMDLNKTASTSDKISGAISITYGGTLSLNNLAGTLAGGDSFKLFNAGSYSGTFASISPATPGSGLTWDTNALASTGTIKVASAAPPPSITGITVSGGNIVIAGRNNTGAGGTYHILTSTNAGLSVTNWVTLTNGTFDGSGNFSFTNPVGTSAQQYYILRVP